MNGTKLLLDTNIALYFLGGDKILADLLDQREIYLSVITEMEMLGYPSISEVEKKRIKTFMLDCKVIDLNPAIKDLAIELRRQYNLKLPDAIIAATALDLYIPLVSADSVFTRISEINFVYYTLQ